MTHPENLTLSARFIRQSVDLKRQCFILAETITDEAIHRRGVSGDSKEAYVSNIPNLAASLMLSMSNIASLMQQVTAPQAEMLFDSAEQVLKDLKAFNKERESEAG